MADTTFTAYTTPIRATWLNDVNAETYQIKKGYYSAAGGTVDAITGAYTVSLADATPYTGFTLFFLASGLNVTTTPTFAPTINGTIQTAHTIVKYVGGARVAVAAGDVQGLVQVQYDAVNTVWVLMNPSVPVAIHASSSKATPVDADEIPLLDSASSFALAKLTWANLKATLVTYLSALTTTWAISTTGNAATATNSTNATNLTGSGTVSNTATGGANLTPNVTINATNLIGSGTISATTTGTTAAAGTSSTIMATCAFVQQEKSIRTGNKGIGLLKWGRASIPQATTNYLCGIGNTSANTTEANGGIIAGQACRISGLRVQLSAAVPAAQSIVITLRVNAVSTPLTVTIGAGATSGTDLADIVLVSAGSFISMQAVTSATFGSTNNVTVTAVVQDLSGTYGITPLFFSSWGAAAPAAYCEPIVAPVDPSLALASCGLPPCIIVKEYAGLVTTTGIATDINTTHIYKNSTVPPVRAGLDYENWIFAEGDNFTLYDSANVTGATHAICARVVGLSDYAYPPSFTLFSAGINNTTGSTAQGLTVFMGQYGAPMESATESVVQILMPACTVRNLRVISGSLMASGSSVFTVRKNGVDTALTASVTSAVLSASDLVDTVTFNGTTDLLSIKLVTGAAVGTRAYNCSIEVTV